MRIIGDTTYQRMPEELRGQAPGGEPWWKIDMGRFYREQYGASPSELSGGAPSDPAAQLGYLKGVSDAVEEAGKGKVRSVPTTRYRATIDLEKAAEAEEGAAREATRKMAEQLGARELPVEVWLDEDGRVRRYRMTMPVAKAPQGGPSMEGRVTVVQELWDFGVPVRVEPPPPGQTEDMTDKLMKQGAQRQTAAMSREESHRAPAARLQEA